MGIVDALDSTSSHDKPMDLRFMIAMHFKHMQVYYTVSPCTASVFVFSLCIPVLHGHGIDDHQLAW